MQPGLAAACDAGQLEAVPKVYLEEAAEKLLAMGNK